MLATLAACVPGNNADTARNPSAAFTIELYGLLEKGEGGYRFSRFSLDNQDAHRKDEAWVDLKTLAPAFETADSECSVGLLNLVDSDIDLTLSGTQYLCLADGPLFRGSSIDAGDIVKNTAGNLVSQFSGMGVSGYYTSHFDRPAYQAAVRQAASRLDLGHFTSAVRATLGQYRDSMEALTEELERARLQFIAGLSLDIDDRTESFPRSAAALKRTLTVTLSDDGAQEPPRLFFDSLETLALHLENHFRARRSKVRLAVACPGIEGYAYQAQGCDTRLDYAELTHYSRELPYRVHYRIDLKNRVRFMPSLPNLSDGMLRIEGLPDGRLIAHNLSNNTLRFESVSLYLNDDVDTQFILGQILPPGKQHPLPALPSFDIYEDQMTFEAIDADTLARTATFGLEITYVDTRTGITRVLKQLFKDTYANLGQASF